MTVKKSVLANFVNVISSILLSFFKVWNKNLEWQKNYCRRSGLVFWTGLTIVWWPIENVKKKWINKYKLIKTIKNLEKVKEIKQ